MKIPGAALVVASIVLSTSCFGAAGESTEQIYLATYDREALDFLPLAMTTVRVKQAEGCVMVEVGGSSMLALWPVGYTATVASGKVLVANQQGNTVLQEGEVAQLGGGEIALEEALAISIDAVPEQCHTGRAYLVTSVSQ